MGNGNTGNRVTPDVMGNGNTGNSGNSKEVIALGGNSTGNTYTHEEPSDSKGSSQAVTGVTSVTDTPDQDLRVALEQVPFANHRQKIEDAVGYGMPKEEAMKAAEMVKNGSLLSALRMLSKYSAPVLQEGNEGGEDMLW